MIRRNRKDNDYVLIEYSDILLGLSNASKTDNQEFKDLLTDIFIDVDLNDVMINKVTYKKVRKNNKVVKYLKDCGVLDYDTYIDQDVLKEALVRAYYEFNHEMKTKLSNYFRKYVDNEINGISNDIIEQEIIYDKKLLEYIKKYDNFESYLEDKINQCIDVKTYLKRG